MAIKVKEEYKNVKIGFNGSGKRLGERNDLHLLAELIKINPSLKIYFEDYSDEEIQQKKEEDFLKKTEKKK